MNELLLVEDNPGDVRLVREALQSGNNRELRLSVVDNGEEALSFLHRKSPYNSAGRPDLVLLDLNLPRRHGFEVLAEIKQDPSLREIPVVLLTASNHIEDIFRAYELGADFHLVKPDSLEQLMDDVRSIEALWLSE